MVYVEAVARGRHVDFGDAGEADSHWRILYHTCCPLVI